MNGAETVLYEARARSTALAHNICRAAYASEDAQEGPRAFAEKRKPVRKGR